MPRSEEAEWWANAVYAAVQEIPYGKVTSYGHIALLLGERTYPPCPRQAEPDSNCKQKIPAQRPRQVGVCLKSLPKAETGAHFNSSNVPWQRVINVKGMISHR